MDNELVDKITSSLVLTSEDLHDNFLAKKTVRDIFQYKLSQSAQQKSITAQ